MNLTIFYSTTKNHVLSLLKPLGMIYRWACYLIASFSVVAVIGVVGWGAYDDWSKQREMEIQAEEKQSVGTQASIAGIQIVQAFKSCLRIGINDVQQCARYEGQLIQEMVAPIAAKNALSIKDEYFKTCLRFYSKDYCTSLLNRSINLSMNTGE